MREIFLIDVLVLNGPGTCAPLCITALLNRVRFLLFDLDSATDPFLLRSWVCPRLE